MRSNSTLGLHAIAEKVLVINVRINPKRINALFVEVLLVLRSSLVEEGFSVQMLNNIKR
jgi:hypothetical protein